MRILFLGDIVGEKTIPALKIAIDEIKSEYKINMVLANGENVVNYYYLYKCTAILNNFYYICLLLYACLAECGGLVL